MPIGIPTTCLYSLVPNRIKMLFNKKVSAFSQYGQRKATLYGISVSCFLFPIVVSHFYGNVCKKSESLRRLLKKKRFYKIVCYN